MPRPIKAFLTSTCMSAAIMTIAVGNAYANPQDGIVSAGVATIVTSGNTLNIHQSTQKAVIDWRSFDIGASETTRFHQPSSSSVTLNRVHSSAPSFIDGRLVANGNIFIVNQNGVVFGQNSRVDVNGLVASTANISDANFMAGNFRFDQAGNSNATIENRGQITAAEAGLVGLVAPNVLNSGIIHAKMGRVHLASGDRATVDLYGDGLIEVSADDYAGQRVVQNTGKITAEGGTIAMTAAAGATMVNSLIRVSGELHAPSVGVKNGKIIIGAEGSNAVKGNAASNKGKKSGSSKVIVDGVVEASGKNSGEKGGSIIITADHIEVLAQAVIDATGAAGGGRISIGGASVGALDASGVLPTIDQTAPVALTTTIQQNSLIDASAIHAGDGGSITIYSDEATLIDGDIRAVGAGDEGSGGFADTSGHKDLIVNGTVAVSGGRRGRKGEWLLDPADITITGPDTNISGGPNFTPTGTGSQVSAATIVANLNAGTNVTIATANNAYAGNGDIFVNSAITSTGSGSLTLSSYRDITVSAAITLNGGSLTLRADNTGADNGAIFVNAGVSTNGGNIIMGGGSGVISAGNGFAAGSSSYTHGINVAYALNAGGGNIIINGKSRASFVNNTYAVQLTGNVSTTGSGTISIHGIGRGSSNASNGYASYIIGTLSTVDGDISITGTGGGAGSGAASYGVVFSSTGGLARTTGAGNIIIVGTGGTGSGGSQYGVLFNNTSNNLLTTGTGSITVTGTGGTSNGTNNYGVNVNGNIASAGGAITINGTGGTGSGSGNHGVIMSSSTSGATITNVGNGSVTINGTARGTTNSGSNFGVYLNNAAIISTVNGALNITGTGGGSGSGAYNYGVHVLSGTIRTTGSGGITLVGTGGNNSGTGFANSGIFVVTGGAVQATGGGTISMTGTGTNSSGGGAQGISVQGSVIGSGGAITLTGTGGASAAAANVGIRLNGGSISNTGSGAVTLNGYGGGAGASSGNEGVLLQNGGNITTVNGALTVNGTGGAGSGGGNHGVDVTTIGATTLKTTGSGVLTLNGTNGGGTGYGVTLAGLSNAVQTTGTGAIHINTNSIYVDTASGVNSIGSLTLSALTPGATIGLGTGAGTLSVNETTLNSLNAASYIFGATNLGDMDIQTARDFGDRNVTFISGGNINLSGTLTKGTGTGTANYLFQANGNISNSGGAGVTSSSGSANITFTSDNDVNGAGNIALASAGLLTNNGTITLNSNGQTVNLSGTIGGATTINSANGGVTLGSIDGTTVGTKDMIVNAGTGTLTTSAPIGATNKLRDITITADDVVLGANMSGGGNLTIQTGTTSRNFYIARGVADGTNLNLSSTEVGYFVDGWSNIYIGRATGTGSVYIGASTWTDPITFRNNMRVDMSGAITATGNASVNFAIGTSGWLNQNAITTQGQNVTVSGGGLITIAHNITTNGGHISVDSVQINGASLSPTWSTSGGNITIGNTIVRNPGSGSASSKTLTLNAGSGNVSLSNTVNGDYGLSITAANLTASGAWGATEALGDITLNIANSITLPAITTAAGKTVNVTVSGAGSSITTTGAIVTGASGDITLTADDLVIGSNLSGTGDITLQPYANNRAIKVAYGSSDGTNLNLSAAEIGYLTDGWSRIYIGKASGASAYTDIGAITFLDPLYVRGWYARLRGSVTGLNEASLNFIGNATEVENISVTTQGQAISFLNSIQSYSSGSNPTFNSNGGNITIGKAIQIINPNYGTFSVLSGGGNISVGDAAGAILPGTVTTGSFVFNAGTGALSFNGAVNTAANVTASASSITTNGAWGATTPLGNINITSTNNITLPAMTTAAGKSTNITVTGAGNSITTTGAITTGANGNITLTADDLVLGGAITGTGTLILRPNSTSRIMRINFGTGDFNLSNAEIALLTNGWNQIEIGRADSTATQNIGATTWADNVTFKTGFNHSIFGTVTTTDNATQTYQRASSGTNFLGGGINSDGAVNLLGYIWMNAATHITTTDDNVAFEYNIYVGPSLTVNAGTATVSVDGFGRRSASTGTADLTINAGTISFADGLGSSASILDNVTLNSLNSITLPDVFASRIFVQTTGAASDIALGAGTILTASGAGNAVTLASGRNFVNNSGSSTPFDLTGSGRWLTYSANPADDAVNGISSDFVRYGCTYAGSCPSGVTIPASGNGSVYIYRPTLTITPTALAALTYGDAAPTLTGYAYTATGYLTGTAGSDATNDVISGSLDGSTSYTPLSNVGTYDVNYVSGALVSALGYDVTYANNMNAITVNKKSLTVTASNQSITYGTSVPAGSISYSGFVNGDDATDINTAPIVTSVLSGIQNAGTYSGNYIVSGGSDNNYSFTYVDGDLVIGASAVIPQPPVPSTTISDLPNTFIHNFQNPEVNSVVGTGMPKLIAISYSIQSDAGVGRGNSFVQIAPELADIFDITQEDIQKLNISKTIH